MTQAYNFSAGPAMLPREVLLKIQGELVEFQNSTSSYETIKGKIQMETDSNHCEVITSKTSFALHDGLHRPLLSL